MNRKLICTKRFLYIYIRNWFTTETNIWNEVWNLFTSVYFNKLWFLNWFVRMNFLTKVRNWFVLNNCKSGVREGHLLASSKKCLVCYLLVDQKKFKYDLIMYMWMCILCIHDCFNYCFVYCDYTNQFLICWTRMNFASILYNRDSISHLGTENNCYRFNFKWSLPPFFGSQNNFKHLLW